MDPNITARPVLIKPRIRMVPASNGSCDGCDLKAKITLCRGKGPGVPCVTPDILLHAKIVGEHQSTR